MLDRELVHSLLVQVRESAELVQIVYSSIREK